MQRRRERKSNKVRKRERGSLSGAPPFHLPCPLQEIKITKRRHRTLRYLFDLARLFFQRPHVGNKRLDFVVVSFPAKAFIVVLPFSFTPSLIDWVALASVNAA